MAMIDPSIDELRKKTNGNSYVLCNLISKRAKEIQNNNRQKEEEGFEPEVKEITQACEEIVEGKIVPSKWEE